MRRVASGASVAPLAAQLSPVLSVAAREGPYAFKFEGLTLWLVPRPRPCRLRPRGRRRGATAGRKRAKRGYKHEIPSRCGRDSAG